MPIQEGEISLENLKFRAWDKDLKIMSYTGNNLTLQISKNGIQIAYYDSLHEITNYELLQSTGLFDKNGTEIYEGDILHHKVQGVGVVFYPFRDTMASFGIRNVNTRFGRNLQDTAKAGYEIIGNKFENPELLRED